MTAPRLTDALVHEIRTAGLPDRVMAQRAGISRASVRRIRIGLTYKKHPTPPDLTQRPVTLRRGGYPEFGKLLRAQGYTHIRRLPTGEWAALHRFIFTTGLVVGLDRTGYRTRYCYEHRADAEAALEAWDGTTDPSGPWIKQKGLGVDRANPNRAQFRGIAVTTAHDMRGTEGQP